METKIKRHIKITYETTDGFIFDTKKEADDWQKVLDTVEQIPMYDIDFDPTDSIGKAFYIYVKDEEQVNAFNKISREIGYTAYVHEPGYYRYDDRSEKYINVKNEIYDLQNIIDILDGKEGKNTNISTNIGD